MVWIHGCGRNRGAGGWVQPRQIHTCVRELPHRQAGRQVASSWIPWLFYDMIRYGAQDETCNRKKKKTSTSQILKKDTYTLWVCVNKSIVKLCLCMKVMWSDTGYLPVHSHTDTPRAHTPHTPVTICSNALPSVCILCVARAPSDVFRSVFISIWYFAERHLLKQRTLPSAPDE